VKRFAILTLVVALTAQSLEALAETNKPPPSEAQKAEARARYERGLKLYDQGAYEAALVEMRRAYELHPTFKILYNLGLIHKQLNDHAAALDAFNGYLNEGGKKVDPKRHAEVEKYVGDLKPLVATLTIQVDVAGAEVTIDDLTVGTSPLASPITVNAGKRKVSAKIAGKPAATRVLTVAGSDAVTVKLELDEPKSASTNTTSTTTTTTTTTPPSSSSSKPVEPTDTGRQIPWLAWGVTGALAVGAGTMGVLALTSSSNLASKRDTPNTPRDDLDAASSRTKTFALVTDVLIVGTIAAAGVSLYLTFKAPKTKDTALVITPTGISLSGSF
jgi:hypothetical protein